jgi:hypothetical protein
LFFTESALFTQLLPAIFFEALLVKKLAVIIGLIRRLADQFSSAAADAEPGHLWVPLKERQPDNIHGNTAHFFELRSV